MFRASTNSTYLGVRICNLKNYIFAPDLLEICVIDSDGSWTIFMVGMGPRHGAPANARLHAWRPWMPPIPGHVVGPGRVGPGQQKARLQKLLPRPGPAWPDCRASFFCLGLAHRAKILLGRVIINFTFFPAQTWPVTPIGPLIPAQAWPDSMLWPDGPGHFQAGSGQADRAGLPMPSYIAASPDTIPSVCVMVRSHEDINSHRVTFKTSHEDVGPEGQAC
jgi:hypothetical protein